LRVPRRPALRPLFLLAALCASGGGLRAQQTPSVQPGERVRVTAPGLERAQGSIVAVRADSLLFQPRREPSPFALAIPEVRRLEVPRGRLHPLRGALIGGTAGLAVGGAVALLLINREPECPSSDCLTMNTVLALSLPYVTTPAGALFGAYRAARTERWVTVPLASLAPAGAVTRPAGLPEGARVRVHTPALGPRRRVARLVGVRGDSLVLEGRGGRETAVPLGEVEAVEIGAGRTRTRPTLVGAGIGAAVGSVVVGTIAYQGAQDDEWLVEHGEVGRNVLWAVAFGGAPIGAAVGGLAGFAVGAERWVRLPPLTGVAVRPGREGGVAVGLVLPAR
jgi:hypothetical protein